LIMDQYFVHAPDIENAEMDRRKHSSFCQQETSIWTKHVLGESLSVKMREALDFIHRRLCNSVCTGRQVLTCFFPGLALSCHAK